MKFAPKTAGVCDLCGEGFVRASASTARCDKCCTFICRHCGGAFISRRRRRAAFCSLDCTNAWQDSPGAKEAARERKLRVSGTGEDRRCAGCGLLFHAPGWLIARGGGVFCSTKCKATAVTLTCPVCGREFSRPPSDLRGVNYCSDGCRNAGVLERRAGGEFASRRTRLEIAGAAILDALGVAHAEQVAIGGKFVVDALLPDVGLVIQWDGDFWHGHPARYPEPSPVQRKNIARDRACDAYLRRCGHRVLRFWEGDVHGRPSWVSAEIVRALASSDST